MKTEYYIEEEIAIYMIEAMGASELMQKYLNQKFGYRRALKAAKNHMKLRITFWRLVVSKYPELAGKRCDTSWRSGYTKVFIVDDEVADEALNKHKGEEDGEGNGKY
jgi:hypothetical protein